MGTPAAATPVVYRSDDKSILLPYFKRYVWDPLLPLIPAGTSANSITLLGTAMAATSWVIALLAPTSRASFLAIAALTFGYLTADNLDGSHARRTGTASPLGEFLDHWLDSFNVGFVFLCGIRVWNVPHDRAVLVMAGAVLSFALTHWETKVTGRIYLGRIGNIEGLVLCIGFHLACALAGPSAISGVLPLGRYTALDGLYAVLMIGSVATTIGPVARVRRGLDEAALIAAPTIAVPIWYRFGHIGAPEACLLLAALCPALAGRMLVVRLTARVRVGSDRALVGATLLTAAACVALRPPPWIQSTLLAALAIQALVSASRDFRSTVRHLNRYVRPGELLSLAVPRQLPDS